MRLLLTALLAAIAPRAKAAAPIDCGFRVMPWDVGISTLKSDRYFAVVDLAQVDFGVRVGLAGSFLRRGLRWVNLSQAGRFERRLRLFQRYTVTTSVVCVDEKHAYFSHRFWSSEGVHADILVKSKFKVGSRTVSPRELLGAHRADRTAAILALDSFDGLRAPGIRPKE